MSKNFFCQAPFTNIQADGESVKPCCEIDFSVPNTENYFKNPQLLKIKENLFNNIPPKECHQCVKNEKYGGESLRTIINESYPKRIKKITHPEYFDIKDIFLITSNTCNLKCLPCEYSSYIRDKERYDIGLSNRIPIAIKNSTNYNIFNSSKIKTITLSGGEPFYDKETFQILNFLIKENKAKTITLDINTNLTKIEESTLIWLRDNFKHVIIKASIDGVGAVNEYLRYPLTWSKVEESIDTLKKFPDIGLLVTTAMSNLSLLRYYELIDWCLQKKIVDIFISPVNNISELHYSNIPDSCKNNLIKELTQRKNNKKLNNSYIRCINFALESISNSFEFKDKELYDYLNAHDKHRNTDFGNVFPEIDFLKNIK